MTVRFDVTCNYARLSTSQRLDGGTDNLPHLATLLLTARPVRQSRPHRCLLLLSPAAAVPVFLFTDGTVLDADAAQLRQFAHASFELGESGEPGEADQADGG